MKRVLVIQMKRIGDVVLTAPALASLRRALPGVEVTLVLAGACGELGPGGGSFGTPTRHKYSTCKCQIREAPDPAPLK